jgi:hypothetical protein
LHEPTHRPHYAPREQRESKLFEVLMTHIDWVEANGNGPGDGHRRFIEKRLSDSAHPFVRASRQRQDHHTHFSKRKKYQKVER